jgi:exo-beta-1,3-glucanase (GH17 family)
VAPELARLRAALAHGRFIAYQPTALTVTDGRFTAADAASIRADLQVLRPRFDSLITYDAIHGAEQIPAIAAELKFRALIIGVWNPLAPAQLEAALTAAREYPRLVVGVSLGNELLFSHHSDAAALGAVIARVRSTNPTLALTSTEPFHIFYQPPGATLLGAVDFLSVNVHPIFQPWFRSAPQGAPGFVLNVVRQLAASYCGPIIVKETGVPSAPASAGFSDAGQAAFYRELRQRFPPSEARAFAYFAAFDAPWRAQDETAVAGERAAEAEAHWGLYDAQRRPKPAARDLPALISPPSQP